MELNDFLSDTHRRVAANCTRPRSAREIAATLRGGGVEPADIDAAEDARPGFSDPNVFWDAYTTDGVEGVYLRDLEDAGLVKNLGPLDDAENALKAQDKDKDVPNFEGSETVFRNAAEGPNYPFFEVGDDHYVFTKLCHAKLTGESKV